MRLLPAGSGAAWRSRGAGVVGTEAVAVGGRCRAQPQLTAKRPGAWAGGPEVGTPGAKNPGRQERDLLGIHLGDEPVVFTV